jgi:hypothetical protein
VPFVSLCFAGSRSCQVLYAQLQKNGVTPELESYHSCFIFDEEALEHGKKTFVGNKLAQVERFCAVRFLYIIIYLYLLLYASQKIYCQGVS